jgi:copper homeostasis protein
MAKVIIECCANSVQSAINGQAGGAERVELCANLELGGTTPSAAAICMAREVLEIELFVLIRPRAGNFVYSEIEVEEILQDIEFCKEIGCEGVVLGALNQDGTVDYELTKEFVETAHPMKVTFHRAFDEASDPNQALEAIIETGCERLLTSGQSERVEEGISVLKGLLQKSNGRISIMAGGGLKPANALQLYTYGMREFHLSGINKKDTNQPVLTDTNAIEEMVDIFEDLE